MAQQTLNLPRESTQERMADALENIVDKIVDTSSASNIDYDNTQSGLSADKVQGAVDELAEEKVDKETGKGLSTNDYTDTEKQKLSGIEAGANKTVVDSAMSDRSTNPLQNRVITVALDEKTDVNNFNALTQEFELFNTYDLTNDVEISVFANKTYKKDKYDDSHVPNLDGEYSVSLGDKTFTETCTFTIANQGKSITEVFHTNSKYILGAKLLKAENDEVGDAHVIADVVTLIISKDAPYTTTFDPYLEHPPATGVLTLKVSVKPDEKYVTGTDEPAFWGSYNGSDLLINNPILTYSETTFGQPKVSGNPITIGASESNLVECVAEIECVQEGSGDPSPENIRPISGRSEVAIERVGKNKLPMTLDGMKASNTTGTWSGNTYTINGGTITVSTDDGGNVTAITVNGTFNATTEFRLTNPSNLNNNFYGYVLNGSPTYPNRDIALLVTYIEGEAWKGEQFSYNEEDITINQSFATIIFSIYVNASTSVIDKVFKPMLRLSTETDSTYEPYKGKTYTIQLGNTIYGGELDVITGELSVTHGEVNLGDLSWTYHSESGNFYVDNAVGNRKAISNAICSCYKKNSNVYSVAELTSNGKFAFQENLLGRIIIRDTRYTDATTFKTAVTGQQLVYELATPYTIQLTPQQIRMLKGTNNLSCNTGNLTIKYYPDNVLGQLKGDIESEYDDRVETLETQVQELQPSLIFMSRERRDITSDLSRLSTAVAEQNLAKYGYKIGDYFERVDGNRTYTYHIADYNTFKGTSTPYCLTTNHIGIVVDTHTTSQWYSGDASAVGYNGSTLHTYLKGTVLNNIKADMIYFFGGTTGLEHLLAHSKLLTTALANWGWQASQYISALTCTQIDAGSQWTANGFQEGEASKSLELFRKHKWTEIFESRYPWLRNLSNYSGGSCACCADNGGNLGGGGSVAGAGCVVGLIIFH